MIGGRNQSKVDKCIAALKAEYPEVTYHAFLVDLSSQKSISDAASEFLARSDIPVIDIIVNSAGVMAIPERTLSPDGIEMHFATNHIGHWLLTCLLTPKLIKASENSARGATRIINVSSLSPTVATIRWSDVNFDKKNKDLPEAEQPPYGMLKAWGYQTPEEKAYVPLDGYNRSKTANVLFGIGANKRLFDKYGILSMAVHPGIIHTELGRDFPQEILDAVEKLFATGSYSRKSLGAGASTSLVAALDPKLADGVGQTKNNSENWGAYMLDCQISDKCNPLAVSSTEAEKLWELSERLTAKKFAW